VVLHRDIKASNIMLDTAFHGHLGDFGLACVVGFDKSSFTDLGVIGTWGFIAPEYAVSHKASRQTNVYAFGVLILEVVTGRRSLSESDATFPLLLDSVWWLHEEGRLLEAVDQEISAGADNDDATRLLLLGLACCNPNPSDRPSMAQVVQIIAKSLPPPDVPLAKPPFVWPPDGDQVPLQDDSDDDDFVETDHRDSDIVHSMDKESCDGVAISNRSVEATKRKSHNVVGINITRDIENPV
jgi:serine/threonine protein kinase